MKQVVFLILMCLCIDSQAGGLDKTKEKHSDKRLVKKTIQVLDSETGEPLIGADVHISGFAEALYTDPDGFVEFECYVEENVDISISYVSYNDLRVNLESQEALQIIDLQSR
ncbi:MAG: hypothetical protein HKN45_07985 [Flavobacteriales bacterium]|nr:hypothetical protein [Flavobacteriales bacterium]